MLIIPEKLWNEIKIVMPETKCIGQPPHDARMVLNGIFYIMTTGAQWRYLPDYYGKPTTVHGRFRALVKSKVFDKIFESQSSFRRIWRQKPN